MRLFVYFLLGFMLSVTLGIATADAATLVKMPDGTLRVLQRNLDGTATYTNIKDSSGNIIASKGLGTKTIGAAQGARVPVTIDVVAKKALSKDLIAKAALKNLRLGVLGTAGLVADVIQGLDLHYDPTCNCIVQGESAGVETIPATPTTTVVSPSQFYYVSWQIPGVSVEQQFASLGAIGSVAAAANYNDGQTYVFNAGNSTDPVGAGGIYLWLDRTDHTSSRGVSGSKFAGCATGTTPQDGQCVTVSYTCPANQGWTIEGQSCTRSGSQPIQLTEQQAADAIKLAEPNWPDFLENLSQSPGDGVDTTEAGDPSPDIEPTPDSSTNITPTPDGHELLSPKKISDNGDGTRTEEQTKVTTKTEGDSITYNIQNTTKIINNTTNQTVSTSTETNDGQDLSGSYKDTALPDSELLVDMPEVPDFYEQKYPEGFQGEWNQFRNDIDQTPFFALIEQLTPDWSGGQCPSWTMNFNMGFFDGGAQVIEPPCWIFPILKIIFIVTALFVARGLIFGG